MTRILVVDDHDSMREGMTLALSRQGYDVSAVKSGEAALLAYRKSPYDAVISDLKMEPMDGLALTRELRSFDADAVVLLVTAFGAIETAVEAMLLGAYDFITKPFSPDLLRAKVLRALEASQSRKQVQRLSALNQALSRGPGSDTFVGRSPSVVHLLAQVKKAAATPATVNIVGESGTGKELVARMVHALSPRAEGPMVTVHCAALAETLLESELFGHERGAFTGAIKKKLGRFELADGGTLFLDEIAEISPSIQTKLLRVLQEREIQRVGGEATVKVDVRLISATHKDLKKEVEAGRFREDLFYRLHVIPLHIPALRERPEDIPELVNYFITKHGPRLNPRVKSISPGAMDALMRYPWPGNVRELDNAIEQSLVFAEGDQLTEEDLPAFLREATRVFQGALSSLPEPTGERSLPELLDDIETQLIKRAYERAKGVKTETARLLGIKTSALYYKLEKYGFISPGKTETQE